MKYLAIALAVMILLPACTASSVRPIESADGLQGRGAFAQQEADAAAAIREMLVIGVDRAAVRLAKPGGYVRDARARIRFPDALQPVIDSPAAAQLQPLIDDFITDMSVTAEIIAPKSGPMLRDALAAMIIRDAQIIVAGDSTAATREFRRQSETALLAGYALLMDDALRRSGAYDSYRALMDAYIAAPGSTRLIFDLELYVRERAIDGLFIVIGDDESRVRSEPARRTSPLLRRVFAAAP